MSKKAVVVMLGTVFAVGGCVATSTLRPPGPRSLAVSKGVGRGRVIALDLEWRDVRPQVPRRHEAQDPYQVVLDYRFEVAPSRLLPEMMRDDLTAVGFVVVDADTPDLPAGTLRINGVIDQFYIEEVDNNLYHAIEADVGVQLVATSGRGLVARRGFYVKGDGASFWGQGSGLQSAYGDAMRQIADRVLAAVIEIAARYPDDTLATCRGRS